MRRGTGDHVLETIAFYDQAAERLAARWADRTVMRSHLDRFAGLLPPAGLVVDLGCGPGHDCEELIARGLRVVGVDFALAMLRIGHARYPAADFVRQDLRRLAVHSKSLDGVWACASLIHVPRRQIRSVLGEIGRVLKPGGVLFTSMQGGSGQALIQGQDEEYGTEMRRLYVYYRPDRWYSLLEEAGFALLHAQLDSGAESLNPGGVCWIASFARRL
ncbi:MAG: class I SAM-dependent methyltransferase [Chloroflexota bacterium]|nr:class I SAM-dependent methyltransferase [Chloroflexota bacterium]